MTVKELINRLGPLPGDMQIVVRGYESGYDDIDQLFFVSIKDEQLEDFDGRYRDTDAYEENPMNAIFIKSVGKT